MRNLIAELSLELRVPARPGGKDRRGTIRSTPTAVEQVRLVAFDQATYQVLQAALHL
jgi:hypothetical protein